MADRKIVVPVKKDCYGYLEYCELIRPYLDVFGMPYDEVETKELSDRLSGGAALVLLAQTGLVLSDKEAEVVMDAVKDGIGLVCTDGTVLENPAFDEIRTYNDMPSAISGKNIEITGESYITRFHKVGESIELYTPLGFYNHSALCSSTILAKAGDAPLLEVASYNDSKIVLWHSNGWIRTSILGPVHGMDDIVRESIVWAAKKPFVMKGMPPFVGMRVDDVWGAWRDKCPENPLLWIEISNKYGFKPWLGVFPDNIDEKSTELVCEYVKKGIATAFPHALSGCKWVGSDIPEEWAFFDHRKGRPWSDEKIKKNATYVKEWFDGNDIPISKLALGHYYEVGENALPYLLQWGCEFVGVHMLPDASYRSQSVLKCGPYRNYTPLASNAPRPVYHADYLELPANKELDRKFFNWVTEIRDVRGYELAPTNDVEDTTDSGVRQLRRGILSTIPAVLFTHESCWIQRITVENWEAEMEGIYKGIEDLNPVFETMDNICEYLRASHDITIQSACVNADGGLEVSVFGNNNMETKCIVFTETNGKIDEKWCNIPVVKNDVTISV